MNTVASRLELEGPAGRVEALLDEPDRAPRAAVVLAHPHPVYGGTMNTKAVFQAAKALAQIGCAVLRFNFRGAGKSEGTFDEGKGEAEDFRAALDYMFERYPGTPLWSAGMSFGSWVALTVGASDDRVTTLIGISTSVGRFDLSALQSSPKPKFLIHGERDELFPLSAIRRFYGEVPEPKELVVIDGADHLFDGKVSEVADALIDLLEDFDEPTERPAGNGGRD
jgi:alpha/beta superfamily hydrolase